MFSKKKFNIKIRWQGSGYYDFFNNMLVKVDNNFNYSYYLPSLPEWFIKI